MKDMSEKILQLVQAGYRVSIEPYSLDDLKGKVRVMLENRHAEGAGASMIYVGAFENAVERASQGGMPDHLITIAPMRRL